MRSAAATASSTVVTASPFDTGMSKVAKNCLPWYSKRSTLVAFLSAWGPTGGAGAVVGVWTVTAPGGGY